MEQLEKLIALCEDIWKEEIELEEKCTRYQTFFMFVLHALLVYFFMKILFVNSYGLETVMRVISWIVDLVVYSYLIYMFFTLRRKIRKIKIHILINNDMKESVGKALISFSNKKMPELTDIEQIVVKNRMSRVLGERKESINDA